MALVLGLGGGGYVLLAASAPLPAARVELFPKTVTTSDGVALTWPDGTASSLSIVGFGALGASGEAGPLPMASMTKTVTALVVLSRHPLDPGESGPTITFTEADEAILSGIVAQNGVVVPVAAGQSLSQRQLLEGMMLPSANNLAESLATWAFGSMQSYLDEARTWLDSHGLDSISVADASGLSPQSVGSATQLAELAELVVAQPALREIVAETSADLPGIGIVENTNALLGTSGVDGIKTGTTDVAGACLLFSATRRIDDSDVTLVGVGMGASSHDAQDAQIATLLDDAAAGVSTRVPVEADSQWGSIRTAWGEATTLVAADRQEVTTWSSVEVTALPTLGSDVISDTWSGQRFSEPETPVGQISVFARPLEGRVAGSGESTSTLMLSGALAEPDLAWRLANPALLFGWDKDW